MPPCWFLAPDFTFTSTSVLRLGTILSDPRRPTLALATAHNGLPTSPLPPQIVLDETNHTHNTSTDAAAAHKLFTRFLHASASTSASASLRHARDYGTLDLSLHTFEHEFSDAYLRACVDVPRVRRHVDGGFLRRRRVFVITGVRVAKTRLNVAWGAQANAAAAAAARGPGGGAEGGASVAVAARHAFGAADGVVFAYRVNVIRVRGDGEVEEELFTHKAAFMTGGGRGGPEWECVEGTVEVLRQGDEEEEAVEMEMVDKGDGAMGFFAWARGDV